MCPSVCHGRVGREGAPGVVARVLDRLAGRGPGAVGSRRANRGTRMSQLADQQPDPSPTPAASAGRVAVDPLAKRVARCVIWVVGYGLVWQFFWRPLPQVAWVNFAILVGIALGTLPPARIRPFTAAGALLAIAAIMFLVMNSTLLAVLLGVLGLLALSDGAFAFGGRG